MARKKVPKEDTKTGKEKPEPTANEVSEKPKRKFRNHPGKRKTRQLMRKAHKAAQAGPIQSTVGMRRLVMRVMNDENIMLRWTPGAIETLKYMSSSDVHRILKIGSVLCSTAGKSTLQARHIDQGLAITSNLV